jgi:hypothetical protein
LTAVFPRGFPASFVQMQRGFDFTLCYTILAKGCVVYNFEVAGHLTCHSPPRDSLALAVMTVFSPHNLEVSSTSFPFCSEVEKTSVWSLHEREGGR